MVQDFVKATRQHLDCNTQLTLEQFQIACGLCFLTHAAVELDKLFGAWPPYCDKELHALGDCKLVLLFSSSTSGHRQKGLSTVP